jgi:hypothetical protein
MRSGGRGDAIPLIQFFKMPRPVGGVIHFEITDILRQFLTGNYHIDTLDKTSREIIDELERVERDYTNVKDLDRYFSECDLVKFAKLRPELAEMKQKKLNLKILSRNI